MGASFSKQPKHIVFASIGSLGDLHPMIALALELQRRGHKTTIATSEFYRAKIERIGLLFHPIGLNLSPEDPELIPRIVDLKKGPEFLIRQLLMPHLRETYEDLAAVVHDADLIVAGEIVFPAPLVAEKFQRKWVSVILSPSSFFSVYDPSVIAPLPFTKRLHNAPVWIHRTLMSLGKRSTRSWAQPVAALRRELGLSRTRSPLFEDKYSPYLTLALFSSVLAQPQSDWAANTVQTGFVFYDKQQYAGETDPKLQTFLETGEAPIVFTLGSAAVVDAGNFYEESVKVARLLGRRAILLTGKNTVREVLPDTIAAFGYAPYSEVLPRAACVVHSGGVGTTAQVLRAGRPQLVMPYAFDQPDNAARVERLGVARVIGRGEYSAARAAAELEPLLHGADYRTRAAEAAGVIQAEDGLGLSCDAIENLLR